MSLGIAMAGGGLKGIAYIGVIKAFEELGIKPDFLSGTSSGSIFSTMYALGFTSDEIKTKTLEYYKTFTKLNKRNILRAGYTFLTSGTAKIEGIISGENIANMVRNITREKNISNMNQIKIPYAISAVDTISTKECIFLSKEYDLKNDDVDYLYDAPIDIATRASMSFPGIYTPCKYNEYNFIDGGTKDNLPVKVLKDMGADKILALSFRIDDYEPKEDVLAILLRAVDIFSLNDVRNAQKEANLAIEIDAREASLLEIDNPDRLIDIGYNTIMKYKNEILNLIK